jgi:hypothetical protein
MLSPLASKSCVHFENVPFYGFTPASIADGSVALTFLEETLTARSSVGQAKGLICGNSSATFNAPTLTQPNLRPS